MAEFHLLSNRSKILNSIMPTVEPSEGRDGTAVQPIWRKALKKKRILEKSGRGVGADGNGSLEQSVEMVAKAMRDSQESRVAV